MKLPKDMLSIYHSLHTWTGITAGMLLFIGFYAGALTMFEQPLDRWASPPEKQLPFIAPDQRDQLIYQLVGQHPEALEGFTLYLEQAENISAPVVWQEQDHGADLLSGSRWHASLDASGELIAEQITPSRLGELIDQLHRTGGVPGVLDHEFFGVYLLGVAALLYFLALVSGLIILLPTLLRNLFALRPDTSAKVFWRDAHNLVGITSLPFHLVISLTVVVFAFHDQFYGTLKDTVYGQQPMFSWPDSGQQQVRQVSQMLPVTELLARIEHAAPGYQVRELTFMRLDTPAPMVRAEVINPAQVVRGPLGGYLGLDPYSGRLMMTDTIPDTANGWGTAVMSFFALHFGSYGGTPVRWLYFLLGLSGAFLFYSGNLLWLEARRKRLRRNGGYQKQPLQVRLMASATVGVCLGSVLATSLVLLGARAIASFADDINGSYVSLYYLLFCTALVWSFWRGAARAAPELLSACALAMLAIPVSSLLGWIPDSPLWAHFSLATVAVDLTALVLGLLTAQAARLSWRRARQGEADSVWTIVQPVQKQPELFI
ncbi:MAG: PepSY domain-containing protein [Marinobacterium sp.]|nr:PepSY domain-containing protein [Marinobacterium sp.]